MVDVTEKDKAPKSEDAIEKDEASPNLLNDMEEEEDDDHDNEDEYDDDEEEEEEDEEGGEEDEEEEYDDEESEEEPEEEKVDDGGNAVVVLKNEGLETNKENAVKAVGKKSDEPKSDKKLDERSQSKEKTPRSRIRKKNEKSDSATLAANGDKPESSNRKKAADADKPGSSNSKKAAVGDKPAPLNRKKSANEDTPESSNKKKAPKKVACMGMVFMCSSKTKADCFRYKILGLPESKKDQVLKIYKGMRLFLFDVDLRLMYGIFKAAGPGGYNIEPKAFKSEFPSQVRFTVLDDCLPLAEENFKSVLKENYYSRNKFEGLLKSEQVKKLCKLFEEMGGGRRRSRSAAKSRRRRPIETRRSRPDESHGNRLDDRRTSRGQEKRKRARDEDRRPRSPPPREKRRYDDFDRPPVIYEREPPVVYNREPPVPRYHLPPEPTAIRSPLGLYAYERQPLDSLPYIRDPVVSEPPTYRVVERDRERDPYLAYSREVREPPPPLYRGTVYTAPPEYHLVSREYHHPPTTRTPEYHLSGGSRLPSYRDMEIASDYRPAAALPPDYRSRTHYKY